MANVDPSAPDPQRVATFWSLLTQVTAQLDSAGVADNIRRFLLHVAWHEGARLKHRSQIGGGPGRSFFQFEPPRAKDAVLYAFQKNWQGLLAAATGVPADQLKTAADALPSSGGAWPAANKVHDLLLANDLLGVYLARIAFEKVPAAIPAGNQAHAEYWADQWKIVFDSPQQRAQQIVAVKQAADAVDPLIPASGFTPWWTTATTAPAVCWGGSPDLVHPLMLAMASGLGETFGGGDSAGASSHRLSGSPYSGATFGSFGTWGSICGSAGTGGSAGAVQAAREGTFATAGTVGTVGTFGGCVGTIGTAGCYGICSGAAANPSSGATFGSFGTVGSVGSAGTGGSAGSAQLPQPATSGSLGCVLYASKCCGTIGSGGAASCASSYRLSSGPSSGATFGTGSCLPPPAATTAPPGATMCTGGSVGGPFAGSAGAAQQPGGPASGFCVGTVETLGTINGTVGTS
jgi:hypothetical protein